jgi:glycosyltransferase involved in cell wall biosynthesis
MQTSILFLIDSLKVFGGAEKNLAQVVSLLDPAKYNPLVFCLKGGRVYEELKKRKINVENLEIKRIYSLDAFIKAIKLIKLIKKNKVKIVVTYLESSDFWGSVVARIAAVQVVISNRRDTGFNLKTRHVLAYRVINHLFDKIIAVCEGVKEAIVKKEKVNADKIITIYNGVEIYEDNGIDKSQFKKSLGLDLNKLTVTMLANLAPAKGHKDLLTAAVEIINKHKLVQFLLVGAGKCGYEQNLRDFVNRLGIAKNVIFAGFRSDIPEVLSISDITVLPSTSEGLSNAILEYMSAEKPVVATDVGGNRELIIEGETGFLVPSKHPTALVEAICKLLSNAELRKLMGINGRNRVETYFTKERMIKDIESLFENLLSTKSGA